MKDFIIEGKVEKEKWWEKRKKEDEKFCHEALLVLSAVKVVGWERWDHYIIKIDTLLSFTCSWHLIFDESWNASCVVSSTDNNDVIQKWRNTITLRYLVCGKWNFLGPFLLGCLWGILKGQNLEKVERSWKIKFIEKLLQLIRP